MKGAVRAAIIVLLLLLQVALSACSAGQVTQTATQDRDKTGGFGRVGDITIRAARLAHPRDGVYLPGDQVEVSMAIINSGRVDDQLVDISSTAFSDVAVNASPDRPSAPAATQPTIPTPPPVAVRSSPSTTNPQQPQSDALDITIPADEAIFIGSGGLTVTLTGLTEAIDAGQYVQLTLTFARAGTTTVTAIMGPSATVLPRNPVVDF